MKKLTKYLTEPFITEDIKIPVEVGDTVLMGRFKNKKVVVKTIDFNDNGDLLINGRPALKFRIVKKVEEKIQPSTHYGYYKVIKGKNIIQYRGSKSDVRRQLKKVRKQDPKGKYQLIAGGGEVGSVFEEFGAPAGMLPSPSRKTVKKMKKKGNTSVPYGSGYKKVNELLSEKPLKKKKKFKLKVKKPSAKSRLMRMNRNYYLKPEKAKKELEKSGLPGNVVSKKVGKQKLFFVSYHKPNVNLFDEANAVSGGKVSKFITGHNLTMKGKKYKEIEFETLGVDNSSKRVKLRIIAPKNLFGMEIPVKFQTLRRGPFTKTNTGKKVKESLDSYMENFVYSIVENSRITKVIGIYGGRFQPFHSGHLATYKWLSKRVDEAFITTSNIQQPPRHPMNFKEKQSHIMKMGVAKSNIVMEKSPYVAKNILKKYDPETTAVVYVVGEKDAGRLGGKYFKPYTNDMEGFEKHGYILTAPQAGNISGTKARTMLGNPDIDDKERKKLFKKLFGYFDKSMYTMMTDKFKKLFETYTLSDDLIEEFLLEATATPAGNLDDGPSTYYQSLAAYKKVSKEWLDSLYSDAGWKVIDYMMDEDMIKPEDNVAKADDVHKRRKAGQKHYTSVALSYLDHGQAKGSTTAVNKYRKWMTDVVKPLGWEIVNWMGTDAAIDNVIGTLFAAGASGDSYDVELKEQINPKSQLKQRSKEKELLLMGGAYGHLNHPFDDKNLTFGDFKTLIINTLQGNLSSEGAVTEKTDGQNIMISWKNNKLIAARNKGHIKNFGANSLDVKGIANMFAGRGDIEKAFTSAMIDLQIAISGLTKKQKDKVFAEGKKFMSLEVIYPKTANVIPYDKSILQFHGTIEYDANGTPIGSDRESARMLAGMIKQINQNIQKTYSITQPFVASLPKVKNFDERQSYFLGKLSRLQNQFKLSDKDTLADYHQAYWLEYIYNGAKQTDYPNPDNKILMSLVKRWAFLDKSYKIPQIKKDLKEYPKFLDWILSTDKKDLQKLQKQHIRDWEVLFFELGAEVLKNIRDFIAANPDKAVQKIKNDLGKAIEKVRKAKDPSQLQMLKTQLDRLNALGGLKSIIPSEGVTFMFKGKVYKYTGAFAPVNQILGMLRFTR